MIQGFLYLSNITWYLARQKYNWKFYEKGNNLFLLTCFIFLLTTKKFFLKSSLYNEEIDTYLIKMYTSMRHLLIWVVLFNTSLDFEINFYQGTCSLTMDSPLVTQLPFKMAFKGLSRIYISWKIKGILWHVIFLKLRWRFIYPLSNIFMNIASLASSS